MHFLGWVRFPATVDDIWPLLIILFNAVLLVSTWRDTYASQWDALTGRLSLRAKRATAGGCLLSIGAIVLLFLFGTVFSVVFSSSEQPPWFGILAFGLFALAAGGAIVVFVVAPLLALIDAGDEEMRRYQERHGIGAASMSGDGGASAE